MLRASAPITSPSSHSWCTSAPSMGGRTTASFGPTMEAVDLRKNPLWSARFPDLVAPPGDVPVRPDQDQPALVRLGDRGAGQLHHAQRYALLGGSLGQPRPGRRVVAGAQQDEAPAEQVQGGTPVG